MGKKLMVIGAGEFQLPAILKAKEMGLDVLACDYNPDAPGFKFADSYEVVDVKDEKGNIEAARRHKIDGVVSIVSELGVRSAAAVAQDLGLPGLNPDAAFCVTNKVAMREAFGRHSLPSPQFVKIRNKGGAMEAIDSLKLPVVMKPADNSGSRGVSKIENIGQLDFSFKWAKENSLNGDVIIENYLEGEEVTIEALSYNSRHEILAMSGKKRIPFPYCVSIDLTYPPSYSESVLDSVRSLIKNALNALGINSGASHSEVLITRNGPYLVEVAGRGGGFGIFSDIVPFVSGVDIVKQCINIAMSFDTDIKAKCKKAAVLRFFNPPVGKIRKISGLEEARRLPGVFKVQLDKKEGDAFSLIRRDGERPGLMITFGEDRKEAVEKADLVEKTVQFDIEGIQ